MPAHAIRRYVVTCGLLIVPILVGNAVFIGRLPPAIANPQIWNAIPPRLAQAENVLRTLVFAVPFFMPLQVSTRTQKRGLSLFLVGAVVYAASWWMLIVWPESPWSTSATGFLAPAYTPAPWLLGIALLGREFSWGSRCRPWMYATLSTLFLAAHIAHAAVVYVHNY